MIVPSTNVELRTLHRKSKRNFKFQDIIKKDSTPPNEILNIVFPLISAGPQISGAALGIYIETSAAL